MAELDTDTGWTVLLHLSDVHFRSFRGNVYSSHDDLQNEVKRDAADFCKEFGPPTAILVCGDVAFSGQTEEFELAGRWLAELAAATGTRPDHIFTVPGNHDVVRSVIEGSQLLTMIHKELRPVDPEAVDERLDTFLKKDPEAAELVFRPTANYNVLAARFGCDVTPARPFWEHDLELNDGSILRLRGLNSAIVSDKDDNDAANKLCVGSAQFTLQRTDGIEYAVLCHHPPSWLRDQDAIEDTLNNRARLQLFGHKHRQRLVRINDSIRLSAGAVGPDPREPRWQPRYNFIRVRIEQTTKRTMRVRVHPRVWNDEKARFEAASGDVPFEEHDLPVSAWTAPSAPIPREPASTSSETTVLVSGDGERRGLMDARRLLTYRFLTLPYPARFQVAQSLGLLDEDDRGLTETETYRLWFKRAADRHQLEALWDAVERQQPTSPVASNPFRKE
jgi:hypothetical protein